MTDTDLQGARMFPVAEPDDDAPVGIAQAMQRAIADEQFHLVFQPQIDVASGAIVGAEALLRWQHPQLGIIGPAHFLPLAERNGLIVAIGDWALRRACMLARKWQRQGLPAFRTMVNVSGAQLAPGFAARVERLLRETGLQPQRLGLELTEAAAMRDAGVVAAELAQLRALGLEIALDDFGAGASSLACLRRLPLDTVKIDRSLVSELGEDDAALPIVRAIVAMCRSLGLRTLAEGVASASQLELLAASGCDLFQGFHFSAPVSARELEAMLLAGRRQPVPERACAARSSVDLRAAPSGRRFCRVLLVDDEPQVIEQLRQRLALSFGDALQLSACTDARDAAQRLRSTRFDIVATDLRMPVIDGISLLNMARQVQPDAVRLMLLGPADLARVLEDPRQVDVFRYVAKPGTPDQVAAHFRAAIQQVHRLGACAVPERDAGALKRPPDTATLELIELRDVASAIPRVERVERVEHDVFEELVLPSQLLTMPGDLWAPARPPARSAARADVDR